jgi:hypothetical protein
MIPPIPCFARRLTLREGISKAKKGGSEAEQYKREGIREGSKGNRRFPLKGRYKGRIKRKP